MMMICTVCSFQTTSTANGICPACGGIARTDTTLPPERLSGLDLGLGFTLPWSGIVQAVIAAGMLFVLFAIVPKFEMIYRELGIALPGLTEVVLTCSRYSAILLLLAIAWPFFHGWVIYRLQQNRQAYAATRWRSLTWVGLLLLAALLVIGIFAPLVKIIDELGKADASGSPGSYAPEASSSATGPSAAATPASATSSATSSATRAATTP